jgi:hypothetical protein
VQRPSIWRSHKVFRLCVYVALYVLRCALCNCLFDVTRTGGRPPAICASGHLFTVDVLLVCRANPNQKDLKPLAPLEVNSAQKVLRIIILLYDHNGTNPLPLKSPPPHPPPSPPSCLSFLTSP